MDPFEEFNNPSSQDDDFDRLEVQAASEEALMNEQRGENLPTGTSGLTGFPAMDSQSSSQVHLPRTIVQDVSQAPGLPIGDYNHFGAIFEQSSYLQEPGHSIPPLATHPTESVAEYSYTTGVVGTGNPNQYNNTGLPMTSNTHGQQMPSQTVAPMNTNRDDDMIMDTTPKSSDQQLDVAGSHSRLKAQNRTNIDQAQNCVPMEHPGKLFGEQGDTKNNSNPDTVGNPNDPKVASTAPFLPAASLELTGTPTQATLNAGSPAPNILNIVMGKKRAPSNAPVQPEVNTLDAEAEDETLHSQPESSEQNEASGSQNETSSKKKGRKRKTDRAVRRVLFAKKERDAATEFMSDKIDLMDILPRADCDFLAKKFWIFTKKQLSYALLPGSVNPSDLRAADSDRIILNPGIVKSESEAAGETANSIPSPDELKDKLRDAIAKFQWTETPQDGDAKVDESTPGDTTTVSNPEAIDSSADLLNEVELRLTRWQKALEEYGDPPKGLHERFPLNGPVSVLFPKSLRNILESISVTHLYDYLAIKKTETGALCELIRVWRNHCGLNEMVPLSIAKCMLGVAYRVEHAVGSVPPLSESTRKWMKDPLVVLTGAAREFLVEDRKIYSAQEFINMRTKDLATGLVSWRDKKGMEELKGSGKVAMISSWKALAKDAVDTDLFAGQVVPKDVDLESLASVDGPIFRTDGPREEKQKTPASKPVMMDNTDLVLSRQHQYALHSKLFLEDTLDEAVIQLLYSVGIETADSLLKADSKADAPLINAMMNGKVAKDPSRCQAIVDTWRQKLRNGLAQLQPLNAPVEPETKKPKLEPIQSPPVRPRSTSNKDPFFSLSAQTQRFLTSIHIDSAETFLSTRTTDIAHEFVRWRKEEGLSELRGLGAIASVSGWKATVRKAAKDAGIEGLTELEPPGKTNSQIVVSSKKKHHLDSKKTVSPMREKEIHSYYTHGDVLFNKARLAFATQCDSAGNQFRFELSVRKASKEKSDLTLFVSYKGCFSAVDVDKSQRDSDTVTVIDQSCGDDQFELKCLDDVPFSRSDLSNTDLRATFQSVKSGIVNLNPYGVRPMAKRDLSFMKEVLRSFVLNGETKISHTTMPPIPSPQNILVRRWGVNTQRCYLFMDKPIERGQTVTLHYPRPEVVFISGLFDGKKNQVRLFLLESFLLLCGEDLAALGSFLQNDVSCHTTLETDLRQSPLQAPATTFATILHRVKSRQRLHWVTRQIAATLGPVSKAMLPVELVDRLYFLRSESIQYLSADQIESIRSAIIDEMKDDIESLLYSDPFFVEQQKWCRAARELYNALLADFSNFYLSEKPDEEIFIDHMFLTTFKKFCEKKFEVAECVLETGKVACLSEGDKPEPKMLSPEELSNEAAAINQEWYQQLFFKVADGLAKAFSLIVSPSELHYKKIATSMKIKIPRAIIDGAQIMSQKLCPLMYGYGLRLCRIDYEPHSYQFFLGTVWPVLRGMGWRLEAGKTPSDIAYVPPNPTKGNESRRTFMIRQERERKRARISKQVKNMGFDPMPKLIKRLFLAANADDSNTDEVKESDVASNPTVTVEEILNQFLAQVKLGISDDDTQGSYRAKSIVDGIHNCFNAVAPYLVSDDALDDAINDEMPHKKYGCETLLQFLLIMPSILRQSGIPQTRLTDTLLVIRELVYFVASNYKQFFNETRLPPDEVYVSDIRIPPPSLGMKLQFSQGSKGAGNDAQVDTDTILSEVVTEEDKSDLTDFNRIVLEQSIPCRATEEDVGRRNRRIEEGSPGLACRHCKETGNGRFFYSSVDSLMSSPATFEKHILKCAHVPLEIKEKVTAARKSHAEQRKQLVTGSAHAFFLRLWDRLRNSQIADGQAGLYMKEASGSSTDKKSIDGDDDELGPEFRDHVALLDHIRNNDPWKSDSKLLEALNQYYNCLDYGGRIYNTDAMPKQFSAEWLLAKVVPKLVRYKKRSSLST